MLKEFKEFSMRGNMVDMAVGVIIGSAFGKVVASLVNDVLMPPIGVVLGRVDFSKLAITLYHSGASAPVIIKYGAFINTVINFMIVSFAMFVLIKQVNRFTRLQQSFPDPTKECPYCCSKINIRAIRCPSCTAKLEATS